MKDQETEIFTETYRGTVDQPGTYDEPESFTGAASEHEMHEESGAEVYASAEENMADAFWRKQVSVLKSSYINTAIIIINILVFGYSFFAGSPFVERFEQRSDLIILGSDYYRLLTSMFLHADLEHLFSNMIILFFIGSNVEYDLGHLPYLILYFVSGIVGNLISTAYDYMTASFIPSIGASGAVFGVIGAVIIIVLFGRKNLRRGSNLVIRLALMVVMSVYSGFTGSNIDNAAHIGGLLGGIVVTLLITLILRKEYTMEEWL